MSNSARVRCFSLVSYLNEEQIAKVLNDHNKHIKAFAYILHDLDTTDGGHLKPLHYHILISTYNAYTVTAVNRWFLGFQDEYGKDINTFCERVNDKTQAYMYLTHSTDRAIADGKYQYNVDDIHSINSSFFIDNVHADDSILSALNEMLEGVPLCEIAQKYGRDFILHYGHIKTLFNDIINQTGGKLQ